VLAEIREYCPRLRPLLAESEDRSLVPTPVFNPPRED
jgi:hypothetical protein